MDLTAATTVDAYVVDRGGVDVNIYLLAGSLSPAACVASGDATASATIGPGTLYIVIDTPAPSADGEFLLVVEARGA